MGNCTSCENSCPSVKQCGQFWSVSAHVLLAVCCVGIAVANRLTPIENGWSPSDGVGQFSYFFHRVVATDFRRQTSDLDAHTHCPPAFNATGARRGVDSLSTCLLRKGPADSLQSDVNVQECLEIDGVVPVYELWFAGVVPSVEYVFWAFLFITASCCTSFSRLDGYPNLRQSYRFIVPMLPAVLNSVVFVLNFVNWAGDVDGFETPYNTEVRVRVPETCSTIRFVFALVLVGFLLQIPHLLNNFNVPCFVYQEGFLVPGFSDEDSNFGKLKNYRKMHPDESNKDDFISFRNKFNEETDTGKGPAYEEIQSNIYASELNQRDEQFRVGFWQAVSEDANFTIGAILLAVAFSAHAGVHDDSTLMVDLCCVGGVGFLQHMSHVLMLVKEYVFQDTNEYHGPGVGKQDDISPEQEDEVCRHIGRTRVMIHFFVFSLAVFYCNRTAPSVFNDSELKNFFEVARFSVILALLACNTMYDIFFEIVHVVRHMTQVGPKFEVNPAEYDEGKPYPAKVAFLEYHAQYRGPYLWRVHLLLPFMLFFGLLIFCQQFLRPVLNIDARVVLV